MAIFNPLQNRHPLTDRQKNCHGWLCRWPLHLCQIWCTSALGGFWANGWNITIIFFRELTYRSDASTDFGAWWLKRRGLAQECAFLGFRWYCSPFKVAGLVHQSLAGAAPAYLADDCHLLSDAGRRPLRSHSNDIRKLLVPRTHNKLGDRSFSAAGPRLWNDLPPGLRRPGLSFDSFRRSLKTHLFGNWSA